MKNILKLKSNAIHPQNNGIYFGLNHGGWVGMVKFEDGIWFKLSSRGLLKAEGDEEFAWVDMESEKEYFEGKR